MAIPGMLRYWMAFGSGIGIEITGPQGAESLRIAAARVRPGSARLLEQMVIPDAQHHAAGVWGTEYAGLLRKHGMSHVAATVLLPRRDVIVRQISLPGVSERDLPSAIEFQMDGLHPYPEEDAVSSWARLSGTSSVLIVITRRSVIERYRTLFAEAGIKIGSFTCSAAVMFSGRRLFGSPKTGAPKSSLAADGTNADGSNGASSPNDSEVLAYAPLDSRVNSPAGSGVEIYGESASRPIFSATFDMPVEQAAALASAELRLDPRTPLRTMDALLGTRSASELGAPPAFAFAAALASACPALALPVNLLAEDLRQTSSRAVWIPSAALGAAAVLLAVAIGAFPGFEKQRYLNSLNAEIAKATPGANRSTALDREIATVRQNTLLLDEIRSRSKADMDVLGELTRILPPPTWLNLLEINRTQVSLAGETAQAAPLLGTIDGSPLFQASEFAAPPLRTTGGEAFRIRTNREPGR